MCLCTQALAYRTSGASCRVRATTVLGWMPKTGSALHREGRMASNLVLRKVPTTGRPPPEPGSQQYRVQEQKPELLPRPMSKRLFGGSTLWAESVFVGRAPMRPRAPCLLRGVPLLLQRARIRARLRRRLPSHQTQSPQNFLRPWTNGCESTICWRRWRRGHISFLAVGTVSNPNPNRARHRQRGSHCSARPRLGCGELLPGRA